MPSFISNIDKQVYYALGKSGINLIYEIGLLIINVASLLVTVQFGVMWIAVGATIVEWFGCLKISIGQITSALVKRPFFVTLLVGNLHILKVWQVSTQCTQN